MTYSGMVVGGPHAGKFQECERAHFSVYHAPDYSFSDLSCEPWNVEQTVAGPAPVQYFWHKLDAEISVWAPKGWTREDVIRTLCDVYWKHHDLAY